ncbi:unnamed protein product [Cochlearia groenlandica]
MMTNLCLTTQQEDQENQEEDKKPLEEVEREHMFEKVVTPSDVGKLNRLVIPKQHAERYFPLDSTSNEKGLLLNFEDLTGKSWRFRYSYWNSSQSYVMTKGWSRFVKDKTLVAGDIVSFQKCVVGDSRARDSQQRLFIDWRRRPKVYDHHTSMANFAMFPRFYNHNNYNNTNQVPRHHGYIGQIPREFGYGYFVRSVDHQRGHGCGVVVADPVVIESVPVMMHGGVRANETVVVGSPGKRLRLFGVDMVECGESNNSMEEESSSSNGSLTRGGGDGGGGGGGGGSPLVQLRLGSSEEDHFFKKGKSSLSFDFDQ